MVADLRKHELQELMTSLNMSIDNIELLDLSLTHSSVNSESKTQDIPDNERLEFLGDAVLKLISSRYLYERFPDYSEGELTKIRAILVSDNTLAGLAEQLDLQKYLNIGFHEEKQGGRTRCSTLACAFEALLGAFYLDGKLESLMTFLTSLLEEKVTEIDSSASKYNFKAMLQEYSQGNAMGIPDYILVNEAGPAHNRFFRTEVWVNGQNLGSGEGKSKKEAHKNAAHQACLKLGLLEEKCAK